MENPEGFKRGNPMRVDTLGSPSDSGGKIRRPVTNSHVALDIDGDDDAAHPSPSRTSSNKGVSKPPRPNSNANIAASAPPAPPPPPASRKSKAVEIIEETKEGGVSIAVAVPVQEQRESKPKSERSSVKKPREASATTATPAKTAGDARPSERDSKKEPSRFVGQNLIQYGLWAHYLAYGAACFCLCMGAFAMAWSDSHTYHCRIRGDLINVKYLYNSAGVCTNTFVAANGVTKTVCCDPEADTDIRGYFDIGIIYVIYGLLIFVYENTTWGWGLWFPNDTRWYRWRVSPIGILHIIVGVVGLYNYATCLAGGCLMICGGVYQYAVMRFESGDGGRAQAKKRAETAKKNNTEVTWYAWAGEYATWAYNFNPFTFLKRIYNEDKLSSYVWVMLFVGANVALFVFTLVLWVDLVKHMNKNLRDGTLDMDCDNRLCHTNRKVIRYGPFSPFAAFAKAFGALLNLNSSLLLLPVIKMLLAKLNNSGTSFNKTQHESDYVAKFFARPLTRYVPLSKNIEFHKMCAITIFIASWGHLICHLLNLIIANNATMEFFRRWNWEGTNYLTGAIVSVAMFIMYTAAPDVVRYTKFEIFFNSHHFFIVYYLVMFLHGPVFFYWCVFPVLLYMFERYMQSYRGNRPYSIVKVEWIPPVMAIYFRPVFKEDFPFKEGQYLYLNCPYISKSEWHPFTISSAFDDLNNGPRIHLETGEEVMEIPRPKSHPTGAKWSKYCLVSQDWTQLDPMHYLEKSETGYNDYVSVHVKVHGLEEPTARTWTRKLKEYFELMSPGKKFPFYFFKRDNRGDVIIGRQFGPDGKQILCVDGPHSAPSEHYVNYGTVMIVGAGIGLTPCASILSALTKYRWKKNFNPELLHFYWVVRQNEIDSFQWLVHMLTELSYELKKSKQNGQIEKKYYCEINIYITGVEKSKKDVLPLFRPKKTFNPSNCMPNFTADELYSKMLNPTVESRGQVKKMKDSNAENRLQDIWIWNGRPYWDEVFKEMKDQRQHSDIGVCFCGAPVIGADLKTMCEKYSNTDEDCLFSLHKENF